MERWETLSQCERTHHSRQKRNVIFLGPPSVCLSVGSGLDMIVVYGGECEVWWDCVLLKVVDC
jgi:hypothetical protein